MALKRSAGIAIIWNGQILLSHATGSPWHKSYSIIKGGIEEGESIEAAAIREFGEETGHKLSAAIISKVRNAPMLNVQNTTKVLTALIIEIQDPSEIGLETTTTSKTVHTVYPKADLQLEEIDWAGFVDLEEAKSRMAPYQLPILHQAYEMVSGGKGTAKQLPDQVKEIKKAEINYNGVVFKLVDKHGFWDFSITGHNTIYRATPAIGIKKGDIFNVYYGDNSKAGFVWEGRDYLSPGSGENNEHAIEVDLEKSIRAHEHELESEPKEKIMETGKNEVITSTNLTKVVSDQAAQVPYIPVSDVCSENLGTVVPRGMISEMYMALNTVKEMLMKDKGMDLDDYVQDRLAYSPEELGIDRKLYDKATPAEKKKLINSKLCLAFAGEQMDALALAIFNIERNSAAGYGMIVGDMTGIGKGRIAAGLIRYCIKFHKKVPIFITEKSYLFSDIYRDLEDIKSDPMIPLYHRDPSLDYEKQIRMSNAEVEKMIIEREEMGETHEEAKEAVEEMRMKGSRTILGYRLNKNYAKEEDRLSKHILKITPFILNAKKDESKIKDSSGNIIYEPQSQNEEFKKILESKKVPRGYNLVMLTYSQINAFGISAKKAFLNDIAKDTIIICDESHTASGLSNTGMYIFDLLSKALGAAFLSATYSKRPDNMVVYASKTSLREAELSKEDLISAIKKGGVPLQEIIGSQLVAEGQMVRRERTYEGVDILWNILDRSMADEGHPEFDLKDKHSAIANMFTEILRDIIELQNEMIRPWLKQLNPKELVDFVEKIMPGERIVIEKGQDVKKMLTSSPIFSRVFNLINQLLFSIKSEAIAERAVNYMKQGKKPVIAFSNTMGAFLESMQNEDGTSLSSGDEISTDFRLVLAKLLQTTLTLSLKDPQGKGSRKIKLHKTDLPVDARQFFQLIEQKIARVSIGISISPIDVLLFKIREAGFKVEEVTGRKAVVSFSDNSFMNGTFEIRQRPATADTFRDFNENKIDCVLINQSGAVGASFHASPRPKVNLVRYKKDGKVVSTPYLTGMKEKLIIPDSLEPRNEIKQRVMIMLQSELNINTEVQKRGRIFRSGQVLPPMYEYLSSAIPSERRLQMMMQKKLNSLDANTSANQDSSREVVNIVDFLNEYGDEVVIKYLFEHKELVAKLGDPFDMIDKNGNVVMPSPIPENAAHRLSGRIAVLSVSDQENFYTEVSQKYSDYIRFLEDTDQYTGKVKFIDLQATTIDKQIFQVGSGGSSLFGKNTILERCEVNNLRKPYNKSMLDIYISDGDVKNYMPQEYSDMWNAILDGGEKYQRAILKEQTRFHEERLATLDQRYEERLDRSITNLKEDKQYKRFLRADAEEARKLMDKYIKETTDKNHIDKEDEKDWIKNQYEIVRNYLQKIRVGMVSYYISGLLRVKAIVIGVEVDLDRANSNGTHGYISNPFAPSAITIRIAVANSIRNIYVPLSNNEFLNSFIAAEITSSSEKRRVFEDWDIITKESMSDRVRRYIITGNILQAMGDPVVSENTGVLIKYTHVRDGKVYLRNGVLLSMDFNPARNTGGRGSAFVLVPAKKCLPIVKRLERKKGEKDENQMLYETNNQSQFISAGNGYDYLMRVPNDKQWKYIFKDTKLLPFLNDDKGFSNWGYINIWNSSTLKKEPISAMGATVKEYEMKNVLNYISENYRSSFKIATAVFDELKKDLDISYEDDYNDGMEIEESDSGLAQAVLTHYPDEKDVQEAIEITETTGLEQPHGSQPQLVISPSQLIDDKLNHEAEIINERAAFDYERKLFKLQKLLLSSVTVKQPFEKGGYMPAGYRVNENKHHDRSFEVTITEKWVEKPIEFMYGSSHEDVAKQLPLKSHRIFNDRFREIEKTGSYYRVTETGKGGKSFIFEIDEIHARGGKFQYDEDTYLYLPKEEVKIQPKAPNDRKWTMSDWTNPAPGGRYERYAVKPIGDEFGVYDRGTQKFVDKITLDRKKPKVIQPPYKSATDAEVVCSSLNYENNQHLDFLWNHADGGALSEEEAQERLERANVILAQLGGVKRLKLFAGIYGGKVLENGISFMIPYNFEAPENGYQKCNMVTITLNSMDTYDLEFGFKNGNDYKKVSELHGIYDDGLVEAFEEHTGMFLHFENGGNIAPKIA